VQVKGKHEAITVYEPICQRSQANTALLAELESYHQALTTYRQQDWDEADAVFARLLSEHPHTQLYRLYRERISECRTQDLGADWNGVYIRDSK
jgi:adenylate cyclase